MPIKKRSIRSYIEVMPVMLTISDNSAKVFEYISVSNRLKTNGDRVTIIPSEIYPLTDISSISLIPKSHTPSREVHFYQNVPDLRWDVNSPQSTTG